MARTPERRPRGSAAEMVALYADIPKNLKAKVDVTARALNISKAIVLEAILERVEVDEFGVITWADEISPQQPLSLTG